MSPRKQKASASGGKRVHAESPHGDCGAAVLLRLRLLLRFLPHLCAYDQVPMCSRGTASFTIPLTMPSTSGKTWAWSAFSVYQSFYFLQSPSRLPAGRTRRLTDSAEVNRPLAIVVLQERGSKRRGGLRPAGLRTLAAALLRLQLDPLAQKLSNELRVSQTRLTVCPASEQCLWPVSAANCRQTTVCSIVCFAHAAKQ